MGSPLQGTSRLKRLHLESLESRHLLAGDTISDLTDVAAQEKIDSLKSYFDSVMVSSHSGLVDLSLLTATSGVHLYNLQLAVDGVVSMYEATGDRAVLDKALFYISNVMESASVIEGGIHENDGYLDWEVLAGDQAAARRQGSPLNDLRIGSAMSRLARVIHEDDRLQDDLELQEFGDDLTLFVDEQIVFKWLDARSLRFWLEEFYDNNEIWVGRASHMVTICHDMSRILGDASNCAGIQYVLANQFHDLLVVQPDGSYLWDAWKPFGRGFEHLSPDTSHENLVPIMVTRLAVDDVVFDSDDIHHLNNTFTKRIWNGRTDWEANAGVEDSPWFHNYIDGRDDSYRDYTHPVGGTPGMNGFVYDGWIRLGEFEPAAQLAGESLLAFVQNVGSNVNAVRQRNGSVFGKIALAGHLARNLRFAAYVTRTDAENPVATGDLAPSFETVASYILPGDANRDGAVSFADFLVLSAHFGTSGTDSLGGQQGDFDGDAAVGFSDFLVLAANFGESLNDDRT